MANEHQGINVADFPAAWQPVEDPSFSINANIHIACEDEEALLQHLYAIIRAVRRKYKSMQHDKIPPDKVRLLHNTILGTHAVDINFDTQPPKT